MSEQIVKFQQSNNLADYLARGNGFPLRQPPRVPHFDESQ
jgi:hypothetical protein